MSNFGPSDHYKKLLDEAVEKTGMPIEEMLLPRQTILPSMEKYLLGDTALEEMATSILQGTTGLDPHDEHGVGTPKRFLEMLRELTTPRPVEFTTFPNDGYDELIVVEAIPFVSLCNHHVIPFMGKAYIGYIPDAKLAGLSKFARVVDHFAKALQVQERLTKQIADFIEENLQPLGTAVVLRAEHLCMTIRGAHAPGTLTYTAAMRGRFAEHDRTAKAEFMAEINRG